MPVAVEGTRDELAPAPWNGREAVLRLLLPYEPSDRCGRPLLVPVAGLRGAVAEAKTLAPGELLVLRTRFPRVVRRQLERRGITARIYGVLPSTSEPRLAAPLPPRLVCRSNILRRVLSAVSITAQARELGNEARAVVLATRPGSPGQWLASVAGVTTTVPRVSVAISWRGLEGGATAVVRGRAVSPRFVKVAFDEARTAGLRRESAGLETIAASAASLGVTVPEAISFQEIDGLAVLTETAIDGRVAAGSHPGEVERLFERLVSWLAAWHSSTVVVGGSAKHTTDEVMSCARVLGVPDGYRRWLQAALAAVPESALPRVAIHGDLTMWNVLIADPDGEPAVVDWENAAASGPPLSDLFYAAVDAELACGAHPNRVAAFDATFAGTTSRIGVACREAARRSGLDVHAVRLCFHETWLRHGANESARDGSREFAEIVHDRLAVEPGAYPWRDDA